MRTWVGGVPTTPDPNTSAEVLRYKWEAYRDTDWCGVYILLSAKGRAYFLLLQMHRNRNGRCSRDTFQKYRGQGVDGTRAQMGSDGLNQALTGF